MSVNKAIIVGRLGGDPEVRFTPSGTAVANFSIATDSVYKNKDGEKQKSTEWHRCIVWGNQAENCGKYLSKGREVYVEGEIKTRSYDDKDGNKRYVTEIVARDVKFLGGAGESNGESRQASNKAPEKKNENIPVEDGDEEIPF